MGKIGPWTVEDKNFMAKNFTSMSPQKIGEILDRNPTRIKRFIEKNYSGKLLGSSDPEYNVKKSIVWKVLKEQFSPPELEMFIFHYTNIVGQFRNDVFPTEELQIIDACKLQVLMDRSLTQQQQCMTLINSLTTQVEDAKKIQNHELVHSLERQVATLRSSQESMNSDNKTMLDQKNKIFREMKATRDQRLKVVEQGKTNFANWMKQIIQDRDLRIELGKNMEKMRLATELEYQRLSEYYQYGEGDIDQPILSHQNVEDVNIE